MLNMEMADRRRRKSQIRFMDVVNEDMHGLEEDLKDKVRQMKMILCHNP